MKPLKIPVRKAKLTGGMLLTLLLLFSGGFFLLCVDVAALEAADRYPPMARAVGVLLPFLGGFTIWAVQRRNSSSTALVLDATGLTDTVTAVGSGHVPWSHIRAFKFGKIQHTRVLFVLLKRPEQYFKSRSLIEKTIGMVSEQRGYPSPVAIALEHLEISEDELREQLIRYFSAYLARASRN